MRTLMHAALVTAVLSLLNWAAVPAVAAPQATTQEHPKEHPSAKGTASEHPAAAKPVTIDELAQAIQDAIDAKTKEQGGQFHIDDPVLHKTWALTLVRIHKDKLAQLTGDTYFACTDFRASDRNLLDVDFYMKNQDGKLALSDTAIHKLNGVPRFNYKQVENHWERVNVENP